MKISGKGIYCVIALGFFLFCVASGLEVYGQNCAQDLKKAQIYYDEGRISEVPAILEACMKKGFNKEELIVAYRLLTLTYLYLDEPAKAESSLLGLLRLNPEYKINSALDPAEFINLYSKFRTAPVFEIGLKGGVNWIFFDLRETNNTNGNTDEKVKMESKPGFQFGIATEFKVTERLELSPEILYAIKEFRLKYTVQEAVSTYNERQNILSIPIILKYSVRSRRAIVPYFTTGLELNYIINAKASTDGSIPSPGINVTAERSRMNYGVILGSGFSSKVGPGNLSLGIRYIRGLNDQVQKVYHNNGAFPLTYGAVISRYFNNTLNLNLGYLIPVYRPKKIK